MGEPLTSPSDLRPRVFFGSPPLSDYLLFAQQQYSYLNIYLFYSTTLSDVDSVPENKGSGGKNDFPIDVSATFASCDVFVNDIAVSDVVLPSTHIAGDVSVRGPIGIAVTTLIDKFQDRLSKLRYDRAEVLHFYGRARVSIVNCGCF